MSFLALLACHNKKSAGCGIHASSADESVRYTCFAKADGSFMLPTDVTAAIGTG